jgi:hypothetical protein
VWLNILVWVQWVGDVFRKRWRQANEDAPAKPGDLHEQGIAKEDPGDPTPKWRRRC